MHATTIDRLEIGTTPAEEATAQIGRTADGTRCSRIEARFYRIALTQVFGPPPDGASFGYATSQHDFGTYTEVTVRYAADDKTAARYAAQAEGGIARWSDAALVAPLLYDDTSQAFIHPAYDAVHAPAAIRAFLASQPASPCPFCGRTLSPGTTCPPPCSPPDSNRFSFDQLVLFPPHVLAAAAHAPAGPYWAIRSVDQLYWSNDQGWGDSLSAVVYPDAEKQTISLPIGGIWIAVR